MLADEEDEDCEYFAYTVSYHPSSRHHEDGRYRLLYSQKELPVQYQGFSEGHLYFPKIVSVGKLTTAHIDLYQTCVDKSSSDDELREDAACDMDAWTFNFTFYSEGSTRMSQEGAYSAYYSPEEDYMLLAFPLWEVYAIPSDENNIDEDILVVKTWSKKHKCHLLEVVYPYQLLSGKPKDKYHIKNDLAFTFSSMRFVRKFIPHRQELEGLTLREVIMNFSDPDPQPCYDNFKHEVLVEDGIDGLRRFAAKRDRILESVFQQSFQTQFWERKA